MNDKIRLFNELVGGGKVGAIWAMENVLGIKSSTFVELKENFNTIKPYCEIIDLYDHIMRKHCAK